MCTCEGKPLLVFDTAFTERLEYHAPSASRDPSRMRDPEKGKRTEHMVDDQGQSNAWGKRTFGTVGRYQALQGNVRGGGLQSAREWFHPGQGVVEI